MDLLVFGLWLTAAILFKIIIIFLTAIISGAGLYMGITIFQSLKVKFQAWRAMTPEKKEKLNDIYEETVAAAQGAEMADEPIS
jgi:hypothetical protein